MKFDLSEKEAKAADDWQRYHIYTVHKNKYPYAGAIGGAFSYTFTPTGLGNVVIVKCMCGDTFNATDYDCW